MTDTFVIPTVDIAPFLADPDSPEAQQVVEKVRQACVTSGFFSMTGHGIPRELQDKVLGAAKTFFSLPYEEKVKYDRHTAGRGNRGYEVMGRQTLELGKKPDLKEGFYVGKEIPENKDPKTPYHWLLVPNVWPSLPDDVFRGPLLEYYDRMVPLSMTVFDILARGMPYGPHVFDDFTREPYVAVSRLLHYPPQTTDDGNQLGAGAHTDFGAVTLLLTDEQSGLQVLNEGAGEWVTVEPNPEAYVVNMGDMMKRWTKGVYKSNVHRVLNVGGKDRYSVPWFFDGNMECKLAPFDGSEPDGPLLTADDHMRERFQTTSTNGTY